ncbi:unnamed protein product [Rhizophagus irregularis]|nr:unnamed protein product [Rhizophagus irregularis]
MRGFSDDTINARIFREIHLQTTHPLNLFPGASECFSQLYSLRIDMKSKLYIYATNDNVEKLKQCLSNSEFPNLKILGVTGLKCFKELAMLIEKTKGNISQKLRLDNINRPRYDEENTGDELLNILSEFSPDSLINITLSEDWKFSIDTLTRFLESYRVRTLNEFDIIQRNISNITLSHCDIINKYIKEGVIKRSNCTHMKHIRINDSDTSDSDDMFW